MVSDHKIDQKVEVSNKGAVIRTRNVLVDKYWFLPALSELMGVCHGVSIVI